MKWQKYYVIWTNKETKIDELPNVKKHLEQFRPFLEIKREYKTGQLPWFSMHWARDIEVFIERDKIIVPYRSRINAFTYSNEDCFGSKDILYIRKRAVEGYSMKSLLGILNSRLVFCWLYNRGKRKGEILELYQEPLGKIPIPQWSCNRKILAAKIESLVDQILELKKSDANTKPLESQIDQLVYELYELSDEDIAVIEGDNKIFDCSSIDIDKPKDVKITADV